MAQLVAAINSNNEKIPTLWATHYYKATIVDRGKSHFISGDGVLLYRRPMDFRLTGEAVVGRIFDIGSNGSAFWLKAGADVDTIWWGRYADLASLKNESIPIPIRPDLVLQVLAVGLIPPDFTVPPVPTLRFNHDQDAYMLVWNVRLPDRWAAQREVWYDRKSLTPRLVYLYDANGRVVLRAALGMHRQVEVAELPKEQWPWIATDYKLFFPESGSQIEFTLDQFQLKRGPVPNAKSFMMPDLSSSAHSVQIGTGAE